MDSQLVVNFRYNDQPFWQRNVLKRGVIMIMGVFLVPCLPGGRYQRLERFEEDCS
jgi:hypothetical protein